VRFVRRFMGTSKVSDTPLVRNRIQVSLSGKERYYFVNASTPGERQIVTDIKQFAQGLIKYGNWEPRFAKLRFSSKVLPLN
jgi:hypothetical protein